MRRVPRRIEFSLPADFALRLKLFKEASGLTWQSLARMLGVRPYRLRQWRSGSVVPSSAHLFALLTLAEGMGLRQGILMQQDRDLPEAGRSAVVRWGEATAIQQQSFVAKAHR